MGNRSIIRCPVCKELSSFDLTNRGRDQTLPTTNDMIAGIGGRVWGLMLLPFLGLIAVGVLFGITPTGSIYHLLFPVPILGGIGWIVAYIYYLNTRHGK